MTSKLEAGSYSRISAEGTCLLAVRRPALRWRDPESGSFMERGKLKSDAKGEIQVEAPQE